MALAYASHLYFYHALRDGSASWPESLAESFADWYVWAALSLPILAVAKRIPLNSVHTVLIHLPLSLAFSLLQVAIHSFIDQILIHGAWTADAFGGAFGAFFARTFHFGLLVYWLIVVTRTAIVRYKDQQLAAVRLEAQLVNSQLQALRMQLQPHFLFNTLNTVASLMHQDVDLAERVLLKLSELLRITLAAGGQQVIPLRQEMDFIRKYLDIEKERFGDSLQVQFMIEPETLDAPVPVFLLQPLVENSIHHGIAKKRGGGKLEIHALRRNGRIRIEVRDDGVGLPPEIHEGIGLSNTRLRLQQLYGDRFEFQLQPIETSGVEVVVTLPMEPES